MDSRINVDKIFKVMGCDAECRYNVGPAGIGPCEDCGKDCDLCPFPPDCNNCLQIPKNYVPKSGTIFEKAFNGEENKITYVEYQKFLKDYSWLI